MRFIRPLDYFLRAYSPMRLLRDFLRNHPAYRGADYVTPPPKIETNSAAYRDEIYENREPDFDHEVQAYGSEQEVSQPVFRTPALPHIPQPDIETKIPDYQIDRALIESDLGDLFNWDVEDSETGDMSPEASDDYPDEPSSEQHNEAFYGASAGTLDDMVEEAYGDMEDVQDDMYDDPYAEQSLEDMVDDPMDEPDDMPEPEPEPEPMDPMDDPLHPYMPYGGFFFPGG